MLQRIPVDLTVPSLPALSYVLRHREHWPAGFVWNFSRCQTCAMGLASELWDAVYPLPSGMAEAFGNISFGDAMWIFATNSWSNVDCDAITPEHVADQIDLYMARQAEGGGE